MLYKFARGKLDRYNVCFFNHNCNRVLILTASKRYFYTDYNTNVDMKLL